MRNFNIKKIDQETQRNPEFLKLFPNSLKKYPPKKYFRTVHASLKQGNFQAQYNPKMEKIRRKIRNPHTLMVNQ